MLSDAHQATINGLLAFIGLLFFVIIAVLVANVFKKKKPKVEVPTDFKAAITDAALKLEDESSVDLAQALQQTEKSIWGRIRSAWSTESIDKNFEEIEEILYTSDIGTATVQKLLEKLKADLSRSQKKDLSALKSSLKEELLDIFSNQNAKINLSAKPTVIMVVGVNGAGKTTSIGKLSAQLAGQGLKVLVAAGDTFRAAAEKQLAVWTERAQVEIFSPEGVKDPSAVAFDAVAKAQAQNFDVVLIDTAGRLHTQSHLMEELKKVKRVIGKQNASYPQEVLLVLDANSGQNALLQAKEYNAALGVTGVILTKMDGTAKGGVAVGLAHELSISIKKIGVGERVQDLRDFSSEAFVDAMLGTD